MFYVIIHQEMQIKTPMRSHFTPTRLARVKKLDNNKGWSGLEKSESWFTARGK